MAFKSSSLGVMPSSTGTGGMLTYLDDDDATNTIVANAYWAADISSKEELGNARARAAAESFVAKQSPNPTSTGVLIFVKGTTQAGVWRRAVLSGAGRIQLVAL